MSNYPLTEASSGAFGDIFQGIKDFRAEVAKAKSSSELKKSSIARASRDLVMSFPVYCSDAVSGDTMMTIGKAVERQAVSMLQMLFTAEHLQGANGRDVIAKFHNNMDDAYDISDYMDYAAGAVSNAMNYGINNRTLRAANSFFKMGTYDEAAEFMKQQFLKDSTIFYESNFSDVPINEYSVSSDYKGYTVRRKPSVLSESRKNPKLNPSNQDYMDLINDYNRLDKSFDSAVNKYNDLKSQSDSNNREQRIKDLNRRSLDDIRKETERQKDIQSSINKMMDNRNFNYNRSKDNFDSMHNYITKQLLPSDVQKYNQLVPTLMVVRFFVDNEKSVESVQEFIAGVKARVIAIPSSEMIEEFSTHKNNQIDTLQFARATTKEISFGKDLVAAINQAKLDAVNNSNKASQNIWRTLKNRSASSGARRAVNGRNTAASISTIVISQAEVDNIKNISRVDLLNPRVAMRIMQDYNLLFLVIVDDQMEVAHFMTDGMQYFERLSYSALEKENKNGLSQREVVNLLAKTR